MDIHKKLETTRIGLEKQCDEVLRWAYKKKLNFNCIWCGYVIPVEGTLEEFRTKVDIHSMICIAKQMEEVYKKYDNEFAKNHKS